VIDRERAERLTHDALVVDTHVHPRGFLPRPAHAVYRAVNRSMPADTGFDVLRTAGVDAVVAKAVGDPIVTRLRPMSPWRSVVAQLEIARGEAERAGATIVDSASGIRDASAAGRPAVLLGVEGADILDGRIERLAELRALGVRVLGLVHYVDNSLGSVCMPWQDWLPVPLPKRRHQPGLTAFGAEVVDAANRTGILVDLAHADRPTLLAACERATRPLVATHTGARAVGDFDRFLSDDEIRAVAATGGLIGLWPFFARGLGVPDLDALTRHAAHLAGVAGVDHLCIGTDMNGVTGTMAGYTGEADVWMITAALCAAGLTDDDVVAVLGGNACRVLDATEPPP
jgi:membrane dipeptidase